MGPWCPGLEGFSGPCSPVHRPPVLGTMFPLRSNGSLRFRWKTTDEARSPAMVERPVKVFRGVQGSQVKVSFELELVHLLLPASTWPCVFIPVRVWSRSLKTLWTSYEETWWWMVVCVTRKDWFGLGFGWDPDPPCRWIHQVTCSARWRCVLSRVPFSFCLFVNYLQARAWCWFSGWGGGLGSWGSEFEPFYPPN